MKPFHWVLIVIGALLLVAGVASAVTAIAISQIASNSTTTGSIAVTPPGSSTPIWGTPGAGLSISPAGVINASGAVGPTGPQGPSGPTGATGPAATIPTPAVGEVPLGAVNGTNKSFTLANTPAATWPVYLVRNGVRQNIQNGDYTITGNTITFATAPLAGDTINADYWH